MEVDTEEQLSLITPSRNQHPQIDSQLLLNGDDDPYKPDGNIKLKIEKLSEFAREGAETRRLSSPIYIRGLPWRILAIQRESGGRRNQMAAAQKCLGYFLQCNAENTDPAWSCAGSATLKILAQKEGKEDHARKINHIFHTKENDWGFAQFMTFEALMDLESGWYDEATDSILLSVDITADAPHGLNWDSKKDTGCIGLKNQGATCYMNSILQTLFFTNKLRKAVYQMPTEEDNPDSSVALAMQRVFYELQFSDSPVGTKKLTKSFGWDSIDSFLQNDVQEFCRVLLDNLENKMKNTKLADTIPSLFRGRMKSYIKCKDVDFESSREECFYDLQLNVKNKTNVFESFKDYIEPEILDGENKYDAGELGLQPAEKGLKFLSFPPVLHLQLMRFQYDPLLDANVKINDRFEFPDVLALDEFVDSQGKENEEEGSYTYLLHAVLIHSGDFHGGHYVAFINTNLRTGTPKWCKFDDDVVARVSHRDAVTANFGGENSEGIGRPFTNAYMLVYIRKNAVEDVLCQVSSAEDIPEHLSVRFEGEKRREVEKKQEREEASNYCEITLVLDEEMRAHHEFELFDMKSLEVQSRKMKVQKSMSHKGLYKFVAENMKLPANSFRLWDFQEMDERHGMHRFGRSENPRPRNFIDPNDSTEPDPDSNLARQDRLVYLEMGKLGPNGEYKLTPYDSKNDIFAFLKFFNTERGQTEFKGTMVLSLGREFTDICREINEIVGLPKDTGLSLYLEYKPDKMIQIQPSAVKVKDVNTLNQDGTILVAEVTDKISPTVSVHHYFRAIYNRIEVEAHFHNWPSAGTQSKVNEQQMTPIKGQLGLDWNVPRVCAWLGDQIGYEYDRILLWKVSQPSEKPFIYPSSEQLRCYKLQDILNLGDSSFYDPRKKRPYKMFYTKLPFTYVELDERKHLTLQMLHSEDFQLTEINVFPRKHGTVRDVLEEAKAGFAFSPNGSGELRLVYVYSSANVQRVFHVLKEDMPYGELLEKINTSAYQLRVEEIPKDQLELGPDEHLFPVGHFDKDPCRMFGVPFLLKISNQETARDVLCKLKEVLHVTEKEFEKYKFHIVMNNRIVRDLDEENGNALQNLSEYLIGEKRPTLLTAEPYLGIDHFNRMRGCRTGLVEKAIVIHN